MAHLYTGSARLTRMCALRDGGGRHPNAASPLHRSAMNKGFALAPLRGYPHQAVFTPYDQEKEPEI